MREIITDWTVNGIASLSVMYFAEEQEVAAQRLALFNFFDGIENYLSPQTAWSVRTEGRELSEADGTLTGFWSESTPAAGSGQAIGVSVADSSQALLRLRTVAIRRGRVVQGRTFIPGIAASQIASGNLAPGAVANMNLEAASLIDSSVRIGVWSRPVDATPGEFPAAVTATMWDEFAVLRRRRR